MSFAKTFMNCMFDPQREPILGDTLVRSTRLLLMVHLAAGHVVRFWEFQPARAIAMGFLCVLMLKPGWQRWTLALALPLQLLRIDEEFPAVANHLWIETLLLVVLVMLAESDEENAIFRQFACWLAVIVFFFSGLQKLWYGTYFDGQFLATKIAWVDHYRDFFAVFLPQEEIARLVSYTPVRAGTGPFRVDSVVYLVLVNAVWISEILAAVLLVVRKTRTAGLLLSLLVIVGIELVAREVFFGVLFVALLLAFVRANMVRWLTPAALVFYGYLICMHFQVAEWLPQFTFYP